MQIKTLIVAAFATLPFSVQAAPTHAKNHCSIRLAYDGKVTISNCNFRNSNRASAILIMPAT
ncbi:hypothetical protein DFR50_107134 [Roseiarcus fermentans]|uniref:Uncharacterized protein n=1 Tax=Roseiarcus fermentans TaxID=1473586 RepID=A0A366FMF0_9HYPH|nr:hypothetical protein DFR50_107134 [Roseiarcus fermentans]